MELTRAPRRFWQPPEAYVAGNRVRLLRDGAEAFPAMLSAIEHAREQILLEMYWFDSDRTGRRFAEALREAAAEVVRAHRSYREHCPDVPTDWLDDACVALAAKLGAAS